MTGQTPHQMLADLAQITGHKYLLLPYEEVLSVKVTDTSVALTLRVYRVTETARELRFTKTGMKMLAWTLTDGTWVMSLFPSSDGLSKRGSLVYWMDDEPVRIVRKYGEVRTPEADIAQREFERMCYRPGTDTQPLDNYERVLAGLTPTTMERYW